MKKIMQPVFVNDDDKLATCDHCHFYFIFKRRRRTKKEEEKKEKQN
jgi:hypothetical protein